MYQLRKPKNRHLIDIRSVQKLPPCNRLAEVLAPTPAELISGRILSMVSRPNTPKGMTDVADLRRLLLTFPDLKVQDGSVAASLRVAGGSEQAFAAWRDLVCQEIQREDEDAGF